MLAYHPKLWACAAPTRYSAARPGYGASKKKMLRNVLKELVSIVGRNVNGVNQWRLACCLQAANPGDFIEILCDATAAAK